MSGLKAKFTKHASGDAEIVSPHAGNDFRFESSGCAIFQVVVYGCELHTNFVMRIFKSTSC